MQYLPLVESARRISSFEVGSDHFAVLCDHIVSTGGVRYTYLCYVISRASQLPVFIVSSEVNASASEFGGGSHYLGLFTDSGHLNMGDSDEWSKLSAFVDEALRQIAARYTVSVDELRQGALPNDA